MQGRLWRPAGVLPGRLRLGQLRAAGGGVGRRRHLRGQPLPGGLRPPGGPGRPPVYPPGHLLLRSPAAARPRLPEEGGTCGDEVLVRWELSHGLQWKKFVSHISLSQLGSRSFSAPPLGSISSPDASGRADMAVAGRWPDAQTTTLRIVNLQDLKSQDLSQVKSGSQHMWYYTSITTEHCSYFVSSLAPLRVRWFLCPFRSPTLPS